MALQDELAKTSTELVHRVGAKVLMRDIMKTYPDLVDEIKHDEKVQQAAFARSHIRRNGKAKGRRKNGKPNGEMPTQG